MNEPQPVACSVLVPVLNEQEHITASVEAMRGQQFAGALEFLVIDGGSTDRTPQILEELARDDPRIRLLRNPRRTIPAALNVGLSHAQGDWVARMDAHSTYPADYLERGVRRLARGGTRWVSGPPIPVGRTTISRAAALALGSFIGRGGGRRWGSGARADPEAEYELDDGVSCGVWARGTLLEFGGWDERWDRNEDSELAARFLERGERLIAVAGMGAPYNPRGTLRSLWAQYLANGEFRARTARWHPTTMRRSNLLPAAVVLTVPLIVAGPRPARIAARAGTAVYLGVVSAAGVRAAARAERIGEAALVPVVLIVMHLGFGIGFLRGFARHGWPAAALARAVGLSGLSQRWSGPPEPVFAPSLRAPTEPIPAAPSSDGRPSA